MSIRLYKPDELNNTEHLDFKVSGAYTHYYSNGICELSPTSCIVNEIAGGEYTLKMEHPYDRQGKYLLLAEDYIICAPVPTQHIPQVNILGSEAYTLDTGGESGHVVASANLYSSVMSLAKREDWNYKLWAALTEELRTGRKNRYKWSKKKEYKIGDRVLTGTPAVNIWVCNTDTEKGESPNDEYDEDENPWTEDGQLGDENHPNPLDPANHMDDGTVISTISQGETFYKVADFDTVYMYIYRLNPAIAPEEKLGFIRKDVCEESENHIAPYTIPATTINEQDFRIYKVEFDDDAKIVTVEARHISYDLRKNGVFHCEINDEHPSAAVVQLLGKTANTAQKYNVLCNIPGYKEQTDTGVDIDVDWSWINPVQALLDPDEGLAGKTKAKIIRDNIAFYVLEDEENDHGFVIQYGKNLLGVKFSRDCDEVITRILPRADDGEEGFLFLDGLYVNAPSWGNSEYAYDRIEMLESEYYVGEEIEKSDGTTLTMDASSVIRKMRKEARNRFKIDKVDRQKVFLEIDFLMLGDTEEYKQYKGLEHIQLYDTVRIITGPSAIDVTAQMSEYEYDSILRRYNKISFGTIYSLRRGRVASYMIAPGGVNYTALAPGLKRKIKRG